MEPKSTYKIITMSDGQQVIGTIDTIVSDFQIATMDETHMQESEVVSLTRKEFDELNELAITNSIPSGTIQAKAVSNMNTENNDAGEEN